MAKIECELSGDFNSIIQNIDNTIMKGSVSASLEDQSYFKDEHMQCAVRVYERYSYIGGNRVSMSLTIVQSGNRIFLSAITAGGSQAVFFKINTFGEEAFLDCLIKVLEQYTV